MTIQLGWIASLEGNLFIIFTFILLKPIFEGKLILA
jgi:hypothetical protein